VYSARNVSISWQGISDAVEPLSCVNFALN